MSVREEFEAWIARLRQDEEGTQSMWFTWQVAYRSGALAMRERAAKACKPHDDDDSLDAQCKRECVAAIRALDVDA